MKVLAILLVVLGFIQKAQSGTYAWSTYKTANWWHSFDNKGWSKCPSGYLMTGLWRNSCQRLYCIEYAACRKPGSKSATSCYTHNVWSAFDNKGLTSCKRNYFLAGLWRNNKGCEAIYCIEYFYCCTASRTMYGKNPVKNNWWGSFDRKGWSLVRTNEYMTGLWRNKRGCNDIYCIEEAYSTTMVDVPTPKPTKKPTRKPTKKPTKRPTKKPTKRPTKKPTKRPTKKPTNKPTPRCSGVRLYEHCSYRGWSFSKMKGAYKSVNGVKSGSNDKISAIRVPKGCKVTIYEHEGYKGKSKTFTSDVSCLVNQPLVQNWNDRMSSFKVEETPRLFGSMVVYGEEENLEDVLAAEEFEQQAEVTQSYNQYAVYGLGSVVLLGVGFFFGRRQQRDYIPISTDEI